MRPPRGRSSWATRVPSHFSVPESWVEASARLYGILRDDERICEVAPLDAALSYPCSPTHASPIIATTSESTKLADIVPTPGKNSG